MRGTNNSRLKAKPVMVLMLVLFISLGVLQSCAVADVATGAPSETKHQKFLRYYGQYVGKTIGSVHRSFHQPDTTLKLPNGDIEEEYGLRRWEKCRIFFKYPSSTGIITAWRFEGESENCGENLP